MLDEAAAQMIALRHYRTLWFDDLPWDAGLLVDWQAEYDAVAAGTFTPLRVFSSSMPELSTSAQKNFEQPLRLAALQSFRAENDAAYAAAVFAPASVLAGPRMIVPDYTGASAR